MIVPVFQLLSSAQASSDGQLPFEMCADSYKRAKGECAGPASTQEKGFLLVNAKVLDTEACCYANNACLHSLLISRGKLQSITAQTDSITLPDAMQSLASQLGRSIVSIIDCQGMTVMPGNAQCTVQLRAGPTSRQSMVSGHFGQIQSAGHRSSYSVRSLEPNCCCEAVHTLAPLQGCWIATCTAQL